MTWETFSIGGVSPSDYALKTFTVRIEPITDAAGARRGPDGSLYDRIAWHSQSISLSGSGSEPVYLPGIDWTDTLTLSLSGVTGVDSETLEPTWGTIDYSVRARPPSVEYDLIRNEFRWSIDCQAVSATVLHTLPFVFTLGGIAPHPLALLDCGWDEGPIGGWTQDRMEDGTGVLSESWEKRRWVISGGGWVPLAFSGLTSRANLTLQLSQLASIDPDGNPSYATGTHTVNLLEGPSQHMDPVNRL